MVQPLSRVASIAKLLPAGHHLYLAGGIASLNRPAKFGFFPAGKELSARSSRGCWKAARVARVAGELPLASTMGCKSRIKFSVGHYGL